MRPELRYLYLTWRFVLDYKIKELKLQIAPREVEIATMSKQIEEMGLEVRTEQTRSQDLIMNPIYFILTNRLSNTIEATWRWI